MNIFVYGDIAEYLFILVVASYLINSIMIIKCPFLSYSRCYNVFVSNLPAGCEVAVDNGPLWWMKGYIIWMKTNGCLDIILVWYKLTFS